jgi:hypothetical protein
MRSTLFSSILFIGVALLISSCNTDKDDDGDIIQPDLTATIAVSGAVSESFTFTNLQNDGASSTHAMTSLFSSSTGLLTIEGSSATYVYIVEAPFPSVQTGTYALTNAEYARLDGQQPGSFDELVSGSLTITSAQFLLTDMFGINSTYSISGSWTTEISDGQNPPSMVTFTGSFTNLVLVSN